MLSSRPLWNLWNLLGNMLNTRKLWQFVYPLVKFMITNYIHCLCGSVVFEWCMKTMKHICRNCLAYINMRQVLPKWLSTPKSLTAFAAGTNSHNDASGLSWPTLCNVSRIDCWFWCAHAWDLPRSLFSAMHLSQPSLFRHPTILTSLKQQSPYESTISIGFMSIFWNICKCNFYALAKQHCIENSRKGFPLCFCRMCLGKFAIWDSCHEVTYMPAGFDTHRLWYMWWCD